MVGTLGSLNDFGGDERGAKGTPERIAKYNGLAQTLRSSNFFKVVPLTDITEAPTRGAHSRSWARVENDRVVLLAIRPPFTAPREAYGVRDMIEVHAPVVVASRTSEDITRSNRLAIVPYGDGEISIRRQQGRRAEVVTHHFGGAVTEANTAINSGRLKLPLAERAASNNFVEWIDVRITS